MAVWIPRQWHLSWSILDPSFSFVHIPVTLPFPLSQSSLLQERERERKKKKHLHQIQQENHGFRNLPGSDTCNTHPTCGSLPALWLCSNYLLSSSKSTSHFLNQNMFDFDEDVFFGTCRWSSGYVCCWHCWGTFLESYMRSMY